MLSWTESGLATWVRQLTYLRCSLWGGHEETLQFQKDRLFLRCVSCGYETSGWALDKNAASVQVPSERRLPYASPVGERRTACGLS
jgi:hypothetical protein